MKPAPSPSKAPKAYTYGVTVERGGDVLLKSRLPVELHPGLGGIEEAARRGAAVVRERRGFAAGEELRVTIQAPDQREASVFAAVLGVEGVNVQPWRDQLDIEAWLGRAGG